MATAVFSTNDTTIVENETTVSVCFEVTGEFAGRSVGPVISYQSSAGTCVTYSTIMNETF